MVFSPNCRSFTAMLGIHVTLNSPNSDAVTLNMLCNALNIMQSFITENLPDLMITTRPSRNLSIVEGDIGTISCTVEGGIPSTLDWYRNGIKLTENGSIGLSYTGLNNVVLTLRNVTSSASGDYTCNATTAAGEVITKSIVANILSKLLLLGCTTL